MGRDPTAGYVDAVLEEGDVENEVKKFDAAAIKQWLANDVTIKLPGWVFLVGGLLFLALALD